MPVIDRAPIPDTAIDGVRVRDVRLRYYETVRGHLVERGLIGRQTRRVNAGDAVRVEVELSEPAFVYLLSFDVVGEERLLWPPDEKKPPPRTEKLVAPAGEPLQLQGVGEGDYFQAFVVVASREPLPGYARWAAARKTRGVWDRRLAPLDRMYRSDGKRLYRVDGEALVPVEGEEELKVVPPLEALCQLVQPAASSVAAVAFPVRARRDRLAMLQEEEQSSASQGRLKFALVGPHGGKDREPRGKPYGPLSAPSAPPVRLVPGTRSFTTAQSPTGQQKRELEGQETVYRAALALRLREVGENHEDIPCLLKGLADVVSEQGKWKEATQLYSRALQTARATFGSDHLEVAPLMSHLSRLHVRMGRLREALHLQHQTLAIYEARLGKDDLIVAASLKNLGDLHMAMQEYAKAEEAYRRSLQVREARLGKNHPDTATACEAIATALNAQGKYAEAHLKYEQALRIRSSALGRQHALTVQTITDLQTNKRRQTVKAPLLPAPEESRAIEATQPLRDKP